MESSLYVVHLLHKHSAQLHKLYFSDKKTQAETWETTHLHTKRIKTTVHDPDWNGKPSRL